LVLRKKDPSDPPPEGTLGKAVPIVVGMTIRQAERLLIEATLHQVEGNILAAAKILRIDRSTLYAKIALHRIPRRQREGTKP
jgi:DNA-binding NtrC family response regulator